MPIGSLQDAATSPLLAGEGCVAWSWWRLDVVQQRWLRGRSHNPAGEVGKKAECGKSARSV